MFFQTGLNVRVADSVGRVYTVHSNQHVITRGRNVPLYIRYCCICTADCAQRLVVGNAEGRGYENHSLTKFFFLCKLI